MESLQLNDNFKEDFNKLRKKYEWLKNLELLQKFIKPNKKKMDERRDKVFMTLVIFSNWKFILTNILFRILEEHYNNMFDINCFFKIS